MTQTKQTQWLVGVIALVAVIVFGLYSLNTKEETSMDTQNTPVGEGKIVVLTTTMGEIEIELFEDKAPTTVQSFLSLSESGFYNGTKFHRVIPDFMIQGGDPLSKDDEKRDAWGTGGPGYTFADEINDVLITRGILAMANAGPNTNGSQFFIVVADATPHLDGLHTAFGRVASGMDVVDAIVSVPTEGPDRPVEDVVIGSVKVR